MIKVGFNYKMTNLHAAIGCYAQLEKFRKLLLSEETPPKLI